MDFDTYKKRFDEILPEQFSRELSPVATTLIDSAIIAMWEQVEGELKSIKLWLVKYGPLVEALAETFSEPEVVICKHCQAEMVCVDENKARLPLPQRKLWKCECGHAKYVVCK